MMIDVCSHVGFVHSERVFVVLRSCCGGAPRRNIGEGFLLVSQLPPHPPRDWK